MLQGMSLPYRTPCYSPEIVAVSRPAIRMPQRIHRQVMADPGLTASGGYLPDSLRPPQSRNQPALLLQVVKSRSRPTTAEPEYRGPDRKAEVCYD